VSNDNFEIVTESHLEANVACWLEARNDVRRLRDQWPVVSYADRDGKQRTHTFDFHVELDHGVSKAVAVKPSGKTAVLHETLLLIQQQGCLAQFADDAVIITEKDVTEDDARNARNIMRSRKLRDDCEYRAALADVLGIYGAVRLYDLVRHVDEPGRRRNALWRLIDERLLVPDNPRERITDTTILRVNRTGRYEGEPS
jgi:hypothetical protein